MHECTSQGSPTSKADIDASRKSQNDRRSLEGCVSSFAVCRPSLTCIRHRNPQKHQPLHAKHARAILWPISRAVAARLRSSKTWTMHCHSRWTKYAGDDLSSPVPPIRAKENRHECNSVCWSTDEISHFVHPCWPQVVRYLCDAGADKDCCWWQMLHMQVKDVGARDILVRESLRGSHHLRRSHCFSCSCRAGLTDGWSCRTFRELHALPGYRMSILASPERLKLAYLLLLRPGEVMQRWCSAFARHFFGLFCSATL